MKSKTERGYFILFSFYGTKNSIFSTAIKYVFLQLLDYYLEYPHLTLGDHELSY